MKLMVDDKGQQITYEGKKPPVIRLVPSPETQMFGRDGFLMHGDSITDPGTASLGCIVEGHNTRLEVAASIAQGDDQLEVV